MVDDGSRKVREELDRVVRRLNMLEFMILGAAALLALGGGALTAFVLQQALGAPFRTAWFAASLLLFILPGVFVLRKEGEQDSPSPQPDNESEDAVDGRR